MNHIVDISAMQIAMRREKYRYRIGLVPTMGALHEGHISLINHSMNENDITVVSIFINRLQFNNPNDFENYPHNIVSDIAILEKIGVDYIFIPKENEIYPCNPTVTIDLGHAANVLEGKYRPGHFNGVGMIVTKLLHIVNPDVAYFGMKDLQQFVLIKKMCFELNFSVKIVGVETIRDANGLAFSSRNNRLTKKGIIIATNIYRGLNIAKKIFFSGESINTTLKLTNQFYKEIEGLQVEYLQFVNPDNFTEANSCGQQPDLALCFAGFVENVRLIDNLYLQKK